MRIDLGEDEHPEIGLIALITEMSREITSTLDLDRVLRTVVNLAAKAFNFDRGAVALGESRLGGLAVEARLSVS